MFYEGRSNSRVDEGVSTASSLALGQPEMRWRGQRGGMPLSHGLGVPCGPLIFRW